MSMLAIDDSEAVAGDVDSSPVVAGKFIPYPYQAEAFDASWAEYGSGKSSTFVAMATGLGKTAIAAMMAQEVDKRRIGTGRTLFLAHRDELLEGAAQDFAFVGVHTAIEKAEQYARRQISAARKDYWNPREIKCVLGSVQSLKGKRLESWDRDEFDMIITDERHHDTRAVGPKNNKRTVPNDQYGAIYRHFAGALRFGLTATPRRKDGASSGYFYESIAYQYLLPDAIRDGWLKKVVEAPSKLKVDLTKINMAGEDYNQGDLEDAISPYVEQMCNQIREQVGDRRFILFAPGRKSVDQKVRPCEAFAAGLRQVGIKTQAVWGEHPDRLEIGRAFRNDEFQGICNADLYSEGVNFPFVSSIVLAAPTASPVVLAQRIGRGTRLYKGQENCLVITFDWQFGKHIGSIVEPYHLVRPEGAEDVIALTKSILASGEECDIVKAADLAELRIEDVRAEREAAERLKKLADERRKEEEQKRKEEKDRRREAKRKQLEDQAIRLNVNRRDSGVGHDRIDHFATTLSLSGLRVANNNPNVRPTERQIEVLCSEFQVPYDEASRLTYAEAKELRGWLFSRYSKQLAQLWAVRKLMSSGFAQAEVLRLTHYEALGLLRQVGQGRRYG